MEFRFGRYVLVAGYGTGRIANVGEVTVQVLMDGGAMMVFYKDRVSVLPCGTKL